MATSEPVRYFPTDHLEVGLVYEVLFLSGRGFQRVTGKYLGKSFRGFDFDLRPESGTATLMGASIISVTLK